MASDNGWIAESNVNDRWAAVTITDGKVLGPEFCEAASTLVTVFDLVLGSAAGMVKGDMLGNANTLKGMLAAGQTLQELVEAEITSTGKKVEKLAGDGKTATCALLWLTRALVFIQKLLETYLGSGDKTLKDCTLAGYEVSLKPHHGMIVRGTFSVCVKACPDRDKFTAMLGPDADTVKKDLTKLLETSGLNAVLEANKTFLAEKGAKA